MKAEGNKALAAENYEEALRLYTEALTLDDNNAVLYSNRSAAYTKAGQYKEALTDAEKAIEVKPGWVKVNMMSSRKKPAYGGANNVFLDRLFPLYFIIIVCFKIMQEARKVFFAYAHL